MDDHQFDLQLELINSDDDLDNKWKNIIIRYRILNEKCDLILEKIKERKSKRECDIPIPS